MDNQFNAPDEIWLQVGEDIDPEFDEAGWYDGGVTWSADRIYDTDLRYLRAPAGTIVVSERMHKQMVDHIAADWKRWQQELPGAMYVGDINQAIEQMARAWFPEEES